MANFQRYIGIDYSGAKTPTARLRGLRVYCADLNNAPAEEKPPLAPTWNWTRRDLALWIVERLRDNTPTIVGIDHGFSFPSDYFEMHELPSWTEFLADFRKHWPTDENDAWVRNYISGNNRLGESSWRRVTETRTESAKSVFNFRIKQGCVAYSTHAGIPWLRFIRNTCPDVHFWPFDGWEIPAGRSVIVEVYPALWKRGIARTEKTDDQHDAYSVAVSLQKADRTGDLASLLNPKLTETERAVARVEGWILGVM